MRTRATLAAVACLSAALAAGCASIGRTEPGDLAKSIDVTIAASDAYGASRAAACKSLKAMIAEPLEDLPARFAVLDVDVNRAVSSEGSLRGAIASMTSSARSRYMTWGRENRTCTDRDQRARADKERADARVTYEKLMVSADVMLEESARFVSHLSDARKVLLDDLSPKGVASAGDFAEKARLSNGRLEGLIAPLRSSLGDASDSMTSKASRP
jgi:hypothetical protein